MKFDKNHQKKIEIELNFIFVIISYLLFFTLNAFTTN